MPPSTPTVRLEWPGKSASRPALAARLEPARSGHPACMLVQGDNLLAMRAMRERPSARFSLV